MHIRVLAMVALLMLAACGGTTRSAMLTEAPLSVHIVRGTLGASAPLDMTYGASPAVQALYARATTLSPYAGPALHGCPIDNGPIYDLTFQRGQQVILHLTAHVSGCQEAASGSQVYRTDGQFWYALRQVIGEPIG